MFLTQFFFLLLFINLSIAARDYRNYTLYRGVPVAQEHLDFFEDLPNNVHVNFWREPKLLWKPIEFVISPQEKEKFENLVDKNGIYLTTLAEDLQTLLDDSAPPKEKFKAEEFNWRQYQKLDAIYEWLKYISVQSASFVDIFTIGQTIEKRQIMAIHLAFPKSTTLKRPKVIIEGGAHAREWITVSFVTYLIDQLLHSNIDEVLKIRSAYEFYFIPVLNPDGYVYTHEVDRLWRKNRNGLGVDLNRNFDSLFGVVGSSHNQTSEKYCGPKSFSELETTAIKNFVENNAKELGYYLSFHSYGQSIVIPYLYTESHVGNYEEMLKNFAFLGHGISEWSLYHMDVFWTNVLFKMEKKNCRFSLLIEVTKKKLSTEAANRLYARYNTSYTVGNAAETVGYLASGASVCWVKKQFNIPVALLFELRDNGKYGFALPSNLIIPTCEETFDAILTILKTNSGIRKKVLIPVVSTTETSTSENETSEQATMLSLNNTNTFNKEMHAVSNKTIKHKKSKRHGKKSRKATRNGHNEQRVVDVNVYLMSLFTFVYSFIVVV